MVSFWSCNQSIAWRELFPALVSICFSARPTATPWQSIIIIIVRYMGFFSPAAAPEPSKVLTLEPPAASAYYIGLLFVIVSQIIAVPLCIVAYNLRKGHPVPQYLVGIVTAILPIYAQPLLATYLVDAGWATSLDVLGGRFVGSTTYAFCAFRIFGAAVGATPKGADVDLATWIAYLTAAADPLFDKDTGKRIPPAPFAVPARLAFFSVRMAALAAISSLSAAFGTRPVTAYVAAQAWSGTMSLAAAFAADHVFVHLMMIYLFLSMLLDIGSLLLEVQVRERA